MKTKKKSSKVIEKCQYDFPKKRKQRRPKDLIRNTRHSIIETTSNKLGTRIVAFLSNNDAEIIKLIYWLITYRIWQCEHEER